MLGSVMALGSSLSLLPPAKQPQTTAPQTNTSSTAASSQAPAAAASEPEENGGSSGVAAQGQTPAPGPSPQAAAAASIAALFLEKPAEILKFPTTQPREAVAEQASDRERSRIAALAQAERELVGSWVERMKSEAPPNPATKIGGEQTSEGQRRNVIAAYREAGA